jgi:protein AbiQ
MTFVFLNKKFYDDYADCVEIEKKEIRPYTQVYTTINRLIFAIPLRSHIDHPHVLWTNKKEHCGLDFSKAVIILKSDYIDNSRKPHIRQDEFENLRGKEYIIKQNMIKYINDYKEAKQNFEIDRNKKLCSYSTMQYFEQYIYSSTAEVQVAATKQEKASD